MATVHEYLESILTTAAQLAKDVGALNPNDTIPEAKADKLYEAINDISTDLFHVTRFIDARVKD